MNHDSLKNVMVYIYNYESEQGASIASVEKHTQQRNLYM